MSSSEEDIDCPICCNELDLTDRSIQYCSCGFQPCLWCYHHIVEEATKESLPARCPNCRSEYDQNKISMQHIDAEMLEEEKRKLKEKDRPKGALGTASRISRASLANTRVVQPNLVYAVGLPMEICQEETLKSNEFFGQFGKTVKVSVNRSNQYASALAKHGPTGSAYVTFKRPEDALKCIKLVDGMLWRGKPVKACFGTTKYCNAFIKGVACNNPDCLYLHEEADEADCLTKEEVAAGLLPARFLAMGATNTFKPRLTINLIPNAATAAAQAAAAAAAAAGQSQAAITAAAAAAGGVSYPPNETALPLSGGNSSNSNMSMMSSMVVPGGGGAIASPLSSATTLSSAPTNGPQGPRVLTIPMSSLRSSSSSGSHHHHQQQQHQQHIFYGNDDSHGPANAVYPPPPPSSASSTHQQQQHHHHSLNVPSTTDSTSMMVSSAFTSTMAPPPPPMPKGLWASAAASGAGAPASNPLGGGGGGGQHQAVLPASSNVQEWPTLAPTPNTTSSSSAAGGAGDAKSSLLAGVNAQDGQASIAEQSQSIYNKGPSMAEQLARSHSQDSKSTVLLRRQQLQQNHQQQQQQQQQTKKLLELSSPGKIKPLSKAIGTAALSYQRPASSLDRPASSSTPLVSSSSSSSSSPAAAMNNLSSGAHIQRKTPSQLAAYEALNGTNSGVGSHININSGTASHSLSGNTYNSSHPVELITQDMESLSMKKGRQPGSNSGIAVRGAPPGFTMNTTTGGSNSPGPGNNSTQHPGQQQKKAMPPPPGFFGTQGTEPYSALINSSNIDAIGAITAQHDEGYEHAGGDDKSSSSAAAAAARRQRSRFAFANHGEEEQSRRAAALAAGSIAPPPPPPLPSHHNQHRLPRHAQQHSPQSNDPGAFFKSLFPGANINVANSSNTAKQHVGGGGNTPVAAAMNEDSSHRMERIGLEEEASPSPLGSSSVSDGNGLPPGLALLRQLQSGHQQQQQQPVHGQNSSGGGNVTRPPPGFGMRM